MEEKLLEQFHFYLSDSNLAKDKFLKSKLAEDKDGWLSLELFLSFNKVKKLTTSLEDLKKALSKSNLLELNEDNSKVRRKVLYVDKEISNDHFIYVENLSIHWDQDKVKEIFQNFGNVTHVSLPKDKTTKEFKGFGFIEFSSPEGALNALNLHGYQDPSWIQPIVVLSKEEWLHRKRLYNIEHKPLNSTPAKNTPHLLISNITPNITSKSIRTFLSMFGPVGYIELHQPDGNPLISPTSCITQFTSEICTERCIYYLQHYHQFMIPEVPVSIRKLTAEEEKMYTVESRKRPRKDDNVGSKRKKYNICLTNKFKKIKE